MGWHITLFDANGLVKDARLTKRVQVSAANPNHLEWSNGNPLMIYGSGDPEDFLFRSEEDQSTLISKMATNGGNCIYMQMIKNAGGDGPSDGDPWVTTATPSSGVDQNKLDQWLVWFEEMAAADIIVLLFFYDDGSNPYGDSGSDTLGNDEKALIEAAVDTFGHLGNIIWLQAEEYDSTWSDARAIAFASYLRTYDAANAYARPIAYHQNTSLVAKLENEADFDIFGCQNSNSTIGPPVPATVHSEITTAYTNLEEKQHLGAFEIQPDHGNPTHGADNARQTSWAALMAGASVAVLRWDIDTTSVAELNQARYAQQFFEASLFQTMTPDDSRISGDSDWAMADGSTSFILYGVGTPATLGITSIDAVDYDLHWLDTESGDTVDETISASSGTNNFTVPGGITGTDVAVYGVKA